MQGRHSDTNLWPEWEYPAARRRAAVWMALGLLEVTAGIDRAAALAALRARALAHGVFVEDIAADLLAGDLDPAQLVA